MWCILTAYLSVIQQSPLFAGVEAGEIPAMLHCLGARQVSFPRRACLLQPGQPVTALGLLLSGRASIQQEDFWGNRNLIAQIQPGELFAEAFACAGSRLPDIRVVADVPCEVLFLHVAQVLGLCSGSCAHHSQVVRNLLADLAEKNLHFHDKLLHMSQRTTREKLLSYLSAESRRCGSASFSIPFTRQQLADYLSVDRSAMCAELSRMQRDGLLRADRSRFTLLSARHET